MTVECPHCREQTVLGVAADPSVATKSKKIPWAATGLIMAVLVFGVGAYLWSQKQKSKDTTVAAAPKPVVAPATQPVAPAASANQSPAPDKPAAPNKPPVPAETIDDFSVGKITLQKVQGSSLVYAVGTVKNAADHQRFGVRIQLNLVDKQNQNVGVVSDYVSVVEPHKDWQFKALLMPTDAKVAQKATVAGIKEQP